MRLDSHAPLLGFAEDGSAIHLPYASRRRHTYVIGTTGTGKSTLIAQVGLADISHPERHGVCVIDPHGSLIEDILTRIPPDRAEDVILIDPTDVDYPVAFNLFAPVPDLAELDIYASELVSVFERIFGAQWEQVSDAIRNLALTLLSRRPDDGAGPASAIPAMDEIPDLLHLESIPPGQEKKPIWQQDRLTYRSFFYEGLAQAGLMPVLEFWQGMYDNLTPRLKASTVQRVQERINRFLSNPLLARILAQTENKLDLRTAVDEGKIILVNLSKTKIGEENARFLGSVFMARLTVAIFARGPRGDAWRPPFHLIVDEFQNFTTSAFPTLLVESRKFDVDLVLAHQKRNDLDLANKSVSSAANVICFEIRGEDQLEMAWEFDLTPPEGPAAYRPIFVRESTTERDSAFRVSPLRQPEMDEECPRDVSLWVEFHRNTPVTAPNGTIELTGEEFYDFAFELHDASRGDPDLERVVDRLLNSFKVFSHSAGTSAEIANPPQRVRRLRGLGDRLGIGIFPPADETLSISPTFAFPEIRSRDGSYYLMRDDWFGPYARLLPMVLGAEFRSKIARLAVDRERWLVEYERRFRELNQDVLVHTRRHGRRAPQLNILPRHLAADTALGRDPRATSAPAATTIEGGTSTGLFRSLSSSENESLSSGWSVSDSGQVSQNQSASHGASRDTGSYEQVPGRTRPFSEMRLELANRLAHLGVFRAMVRVAGEATANQVVETMPLSQRTLHASDLDQIRDRCRAEYCRPREDVERELRARYESRQRAVGNTWSAGQPLPPTPRYEADEEPS